MSPPINYSFSFRLGEPAKPGDDLDNLFIRDALAFHPLVDSQFLAVNRNSLRSSVMNKNVAPVIERLDRFRTLAEHRQNIRESLPDFPASDEELTTVLQHLRQSGLLISARQFLKRIDGTGDTAGAESEQSWMLSILTCDRPGLLARLLDSSGVYLRRMEPCPRIVLIDDSRDGGSADQNQRLFSDWLKVNGLAGAYWGRAARQRLVGELTRQFPPHAGIIDWLLGPQRSPQDTTPGQSRNTATLLCAGCKQLSLDDDCNLEPRRHAFNRQGLRLDGDQDVFLYQSQEELLAATELDPVNPFQAHLDTLGRRPPALLQRLGLRYQDSEWLRELPAELLAVLTPESAVCISVNATLGDPGTGSMEWLYTRTGESATRVARFIAGRPLREALPRLVWKGRPTHLLVRDEGLMTTTLTGIDNRRPIPCVFPSGRNEDVVLGDGLQFIDPAALFFVFNWGLPHWPEPARWWHRDDLQRNAEPPKVMSSLDAIPGYYLPTCTLASPEARLQALASHYRDLAERPPQALVNALAQIRLRREAGWLKGVSEAPRTGEDFGADWLQDIGALTNRTVERIRQPLQPTPEWLAEFRKQAGYYARALEIWPALRDYVIQHRYRLAGD